MGAMDKIMQTTSFVSRANDTEVDNQGVWKRYSANPTLASIQRAIEGRSKSAESDESFTKETPVGIPVACRQTMEERLRESWRELAVGDLPARPSSTNSSNSDDSTPPSTPEEGRSPVMGATRAMSVSLSVLFNPFPDEDDYVDFMIKTASTMAVGAFDPFEEEGEGKTSHNPLEDEVEPVFHLPSAFTRPSVTFDLPEGHDESAFMQEKPSSFVYLDRLGHRSPYFQSSADRAPASFKDLDRLGRRTPQVELNRRKQRRIRPRRTAQNNQADVPAAPRVAPQSPQLPQGSPKPTYASVLASPKQGDINFKLQRHPDEQRHLVKLLDDQSS
ncbi:hypothetical protein PQX77_004873 [Marasmius sp. AFHP31]|nr:hypothetical protein PQX77_004873 [Marasmius sp. AFHP31]